MNDLAEVFNPSVVMQLAGDRSYARGLGYQADGRVEISTAGPDRALAVVRGTMPYRIELWSDGGEPAWSCDCPAAEDGSFCKHAVAVALDVVGPDAPRFPLVAPATTSDRANEPDLRAYVAGLDHLRLVELVVAQAATDWRLHERLVAEAQAALGEGPSIEAWKRRIDGAFAPYGDFVSYREAGGWAADVGEVIDAMNALNDAGHAEAVVLLAEHAHRRADAAIQYVDDSDGWLTDISAQFSDLHLEACLSARPDPVALARRLVDLELTSELDGFHRSAATYAEILGDEGLAEFRRVLQADGTELTVVEDEDDRAWGRDFALRNALIGWALGTGDPDALIQVKQDDMRLPDDYLEVAGMLALSDRVDEAIDWARRGLADHADRSWQLTGLRDFLGELLRSRGEVDASVQLFWDAFVASPSLVAYRRLLDEAGDNRAGWGTRCLELLRDQVRNQADGPQRFRSRPADALIVMARIERLATTGGNPDRFSDVLMRARTEHRAKRNLKKLLDAKGWPDPRSAP